MLDHLAASNDAVPLDKGVLASATLVSMERSTIQVEDKMGHPFSWHGPLRGN